MLLLYLHLQIAFYALSFAATFMMPDGRPPAK